MGRRMKRFLNDPTVFTCCHCGTHLASPKHLISTKFRGSEGEAWLLSEGINYELAEEEEERNFTTGKHAIRSLTCTECHASLGWKYIKAYESSQSYKEGKIILESKRLLTISQEVDIVPEKQEAQHLSWENLRPASPASSCSSFLSIDESDGV